MVNYYLLLTKPGIILGNLLTVFAGFILASKGQLDFALLLATVLGITFIMASACVFNNYIDRHIDQKMQRTKQRALAQGLISGPKALVFGSLLGLLGGAILGIYTNLLTLGVASIGFIIYVLMYSFWKTQTVYATFIGSLAGAVPPIVGYTAVSNQFDVGAYILFAMLVLWQMPHFFSIALLHFNDYLKAGLPLLPMEKGVVRTKVHIVLYIIGFLAVASALTFYQYTGYAYLMVTSLFGAFWLLLSLEGFRTEHTHLWAKKMFRFSLVTITITCFMVLLDSNT